MATSFRTDLPQQREVINNNVYERVLVFNDSFSAFHSEVTVSTLTGDWIKSDQGTWCNNKNIQLSVMDAIDHSTLLHRVVIFGMMLPEHATFFRMKWPVV
jgi:6-phosphogluconate dehydrogenase (decarboxylating)